MDFLVNDLSIIGQFQSIPRFHAAVGRFMAIRRLILQQGFELYCHRNLASSQVTPDAVMQRAIQGLSREQQHSVMQWLTVHGPYWEDTRTHSSDDWVEVDGEPVTDSAIGEAAICILRGINRHLVSFDSPAWCYTPIDARWVHARMEIVSVTNHWDIATVQAFLDSNPRRVDSWNDLKARVQQGCPRLTFAADAFKHLEGHPFSPSAASRIRQLLHTLNLYKGCFDEAGNRTAEGDGLYATHFTGHRAWFSDSSDTEKSDFENQLTFPHPGKPGESLFCTWHGKVNTPKYRVHFSWPSAANIPLYVVYVGPKITKR